MHSEPAKPGAVGDPTENELAKARVMVGETGIDALPSHESLMPVAVEAMAPISGATAARRRAVLDELRVLSRSNPTKLSLVRELVGANGASCRAKPSGGIGRRATPDIHDREQFPITVPWPEAVNGSELLGEIGDTLRRLVVADDESYLIAVLWIIHTWIIDDLEISPIAHITAPEMRCGKSLLLNAIGKLVQRPLQVSNTGPAALFRAIDAWLPTLLIDEVDAFLGANDQLRGILNAGITRDCAYVLRCVGDNHEPRRFTTWGPKVLCGIGKLAATLADRSIPLRLRRKLASEQVENIRHLPAELWTRLRRQISRWVRDNRALIKAQRPDPVPGLHDRANDIWEPLLAIAKAVGDDWLAQAERAAQAVHGVEAQSHSVNIELLADIRSAFAETNRLSTAALLKALTSDSERPWATWFNGKPISPRQLAIRLAEFGIHPKNVRNGPQVQKGYDRQTFEDSFARYLPAPPGQSATPLQPHTGAASRRPGAATSELEVADLDPRNSLNDQ